MTNKSIGKELFRESKRHYKAIEERDKLKDKIRKLEEEIKGLHETIRKQRLLK